METAPLPLSPLMQFYIYLLGACKGDAPLLMPCGSHQFHYIPELNRHVLDGKALTLERFNAAITELARQWPSGTRFKPVAEAVAVAMPETKEEPATWAQEKADLLATIASKEQLIAELTTRKPRAKAPAPVQEQQPLAAI